MLFFVMMLFVVLLGFDVSLVTLSGDERRRCSLT